MIPLITAVFLACMPQTPLQIQQREIHEQGLHFGIDVKYPEIENAEAFNAAMRHSVNAFTEGFKKGGMPDTTAGDVPIDGYLNGSYNALILKNGR
jgi:hypothetical protein